MKIPSTSGAGGAYLREAFYWDLVQRCLVSRASRKSWYDQLRYYFLYGSNINQDPAKYNKIYPAIDLTASFVFASDTTRFAIRLGAASAKDDKLLQQAAVLVERLNDKWHLSNCDKEFGIAVLWSFVYGSMFIKLIQRGVETIPWVVFPHDVGVLHEHINMLDRQEAFVHVYYSSRDQLRRDLEGNPQKESILQRLTARPRNDGDMPAGLQRLMMASQYPLTGTMTGSVDDILAGSEMYTPETQEELVQMYELYVWNDEKNDYQIVTMTDPQICIYDRPVGRDMFIPGEHPFTQVCPEPMGDYFWGRSVVQRLIPLQDLREHHLNQLNRLIDRNVTSPKAVTGVWGDVAEKGGALDMLGALISSTDPSAKVQEFKPQIPTDLYSIIREIDEDFDEAVAQSRLARGQGDTGVRSEGQTASLLRVGSSRPKQRALVIEDSLERLASLYVQLDQAHDDEKLTTLSGDKFISAQFTDDYIVMVDAHSMSPLFVDDQKRDAVELFKAQVIDGEDFLEMMQPPNVQLLKEKYRKMAAARSKAQEEQRQVELEATRAKAAGPALKAVG